MSDTQKDLVKNQYEDICETLDDELTNEDIQRIIDEETKKYQDPVVDFLKKINLRDKDNLEADFMEARNILTKSIDRMEKLGDISFENLLVQKDNPILMDTAIKVNQVQSANVKNLLELHQKSHMILAQQKKNDSDGSKKDTNKPSKFVATK